MFLLARAWVIVSDPTRKFRFIKPILLCFLTRRENQSAALAK
jgi:hypothetical protein